MSATSNRFRPTYRELTDHEKDVLDQIKDKATEMENLIGLIGPGRYGALAMTALEESVMWAVKGITA